MSKMELGWPSLAASMYLTERKVAAPPVSMLGHRYSSLGTTDRQGSLRIG